jgi:hypothetical protein
VGAIAETVTFTIGSMGSDVKEALLTVNGLMAPAAGLPVAVALTVATVSSAGIASLTIAASVSPAASAPITDCPVTVALPLELTALALTVTGARGVLSLTTTTNTAVPEGVAAAAAATTVGPGDGVGEVEGGAAVGLPGALTLDADLAAGVGCAAESQPMPSRASGIARPSRAAENRLLN